MVYFAGRSADRAIVESTTYQYRPIVEIDITVRTDDTMAVGRATLSTIPGCTPGDRQPLPSQNPTPTNPSSPPQRRVGPTSHTHTTKEAHHG